MDLEEFRQECEKRGYKAVKKYGNIEVLKKKAIKISVMNIYNNNYVAYIYKLDPMTRLYNGPEHLRGDENILGRLITLLEHAEEPPKTQPKPKLHKFSGKMKLFKTSGSVVSSRERIFRATTLGIYYINNRGYVKEMSTDTDPAKDVYFVLEINTNIKSRRIIYDGESEYGLLNCVRSLKIDNRRSIKLDSEDHEFVKEAVRLYMEGKENG